MAIQKMVIKLLPTFRLYALVFIRAMQKIMIEYIKIMIAFMFCIIALKTRYVIRLLYYYWGFNCLPLAGGKSGGYQPAYSGDSSAITIPQ